MTNQQQPPTVPERDDSNLAYAIVEQMGLGFEFRNCSCGQLPCVRLRPIVDALAKREAETRARLLPQLSSSEPQDWCDHCSGDLNDIKHILCDQCYRDFAQKINTREMLRGHILDWLAHRCDRSPVCGNCTYCRVAHFVRAIEDAAPVSSSERRCGEYERGVEDAIRAINESEWKGGGDTYAGFLISEIRRKCVFPATGASTLDLTKLYNEFASRARLIAYDKKQDISQYAVYMEVVDEIFCGLETTGVGEGGQRWATVKSTCSFCGQYVTHVCTAFLKDAPASDCAIGCGCPDDPWNQPNSTTTPGKTTMSVAQYQAAIRIIDLLDGWREKDTWVSEWDTKEEMTEVVAAIISRHFPPTEATLPAGEVDK